MIESPILKEKYRVQKRLSEACGGSAEKYMENTRRTVERLVKEKGLKLKYVSPPRRLPTQDGEQMSG